MSRCKGVRGTCYRYSRKKNKCLYRILKSIRKLCACSSPFTFLCTVAGENPANHDLKLVFHSSTNTTFQSQLTCISDKSFSRDLMLFREYSSSSIFWDIRSFMFEHFFSSSFIWKHGNDKRCETKRSITSRWLEMINIMHVILCGKNNTNE